MRTIAIIGTLFTGLLLVGCSNELETGYTPRALNSSSVVRRGYYASPFTPEAQAAQAEAVPDADIGSHRPHPGN